MQTTLLLLAISGLAQSAVHRLPLQKTASLRAQLIQKGTYSDFLAQQHLARATSNAGVGKQPFNDHYDDLYTAEISLGTPPQKFNVMVDSASTDTYVVDARCNTPACKGTNGNLKNRFDSTSSETFQQQQGSFAIPGKVSGNNCTDVFGLAGLVHAGQGFGLSTTATSYFGQMPADGVFGLAWPSYSKMGVTPPLWNMLDQLDAPLFTIWHDRRAKPQEPKLGGLITYGAVDSDHCDGQVNYVPLSSQGYWQFPITRFTIGSRSVSARVEAISDTGSAWIGAPYSAISAIVSVTGASYDPFNEIYTVPCNGVYPDMVFTINGNDFSIPSTEYVENLGLAGGKCALTLFEMEGTGFGPDWNLGDIWIRTYCNVYDIGQRRIGFAKARYSE